MAEQTTNLLVFDAACGMYRMSVQLFNGMIRFDRTNTGKAIANLGKHGVTFAEAESIFDDALALETIDNESDPNNEERWVAIGMSNRARVLVAVYTHRGEEIRFISVREAEPSERGEYNEQ